MEKSYQDYLLYMSKNEIRPFEENKVLCVFENWLLIENMFPWDKVAVKHDLLIPKLRVPKISQLSLYVRDEMYKIQSVLQPYYSQFTIVSPQERSVPVHWHLHCLKTKKHTT